MRNSAVMLEGDRSFHRAARSEFSTNLVARKVVRLIMRGSPRLCQRIDQPSDVAFAEDHQQAFPPWLYK
jgi:hypothetical protein